MRSFLRFGTTFPFEGNGNAGNPTNSNAIYLQFGTTIPFEGNVLAISYRLSAVRKENNSPFQLNRIWMEGWRSGRIKTLSRWKGMETPWPHMRGTSNIGSELLSRLKGIETKSRVWWSLINQSVFGTTIPLEGNRNSETLYNCQEWWSVLFGTTIPLEGNRNSLWYTVTLPMLSVRNYYPVGRELKHGSVTSIEFSSNVFGTTIPFEGNRNVSGGGNTIVSVAVSVQNYYPVWRESKRNGLCQFFNIGFSSELLSRLKGIETLLFLALKCYQLSFGTTIPFEGNRNS